MKRKKPSKSTGAFASPEIQQIEELLQFMTEHNLEEFEYSRGDLRIRLRKPSAGVVMPAARGSTSSEFAAHNPGDAPHAAATPHTEARASEDLHMVKSPIVGTFYGSPSPGSDAFVKVGSHVEAGQVLCIVEAMKLMNEIEADAAGEVVRIFAENGQPVEYGQPLFGIRPSRKK
ncbi:MAG: acetyl-CoA carboxylase biotin carboxyl carrier protein [Acidobacteria bacterium]|nr:MAG: acetyl-CoA carboxylase biotin carboxyl carrier protein [Acidobacteriota bacterium]